MHKLMLNKIHMNIEVKPRTPFLIKSGGISANPSLPDMQFVRTYTPSGELLFIPGSSLKGVFRSFTEKILRTLQQNRPVRLSCNPLEADQRCEEKYPKNIELDPADVYRLSCHACKLYGNTTLRGRISITDMFQDEVRTETRYGVAISRKKGSVAHGPFEMEVVVDGNFRGSILMENFESWQLGLVSFVISCVNNGTVKIGYGKNRGFGELDMSVTKATVELANHTGVGEDEIWGIGSYATEEDCKKYGLRSDDKISGLPKVPHEKIGFFSKREYDSEAWKKVAEASIKVLEAVFG